MSEADVSTKLRKALVSLGAVSWKLSDRFHASRPDLFFAYEAQCAFIEMKLWPAIPTKLQADTLDELSAVGITTYVGQYLVKINTLNLINWVTRENQSFIDIRESAQWLLKQPS